MVPALRPSALRDRLPRGETLPAADWERRHRRLLALLWACAAVLPLLALVLDGVTAPLHLAADLAAPVLCALAAGLPVGRRLRALAVAVGLLACTAILVHHAPGTIEVHFAFFVVMALLCLYEDWVLYATALLFVLAHHLLLGLVAPGDVFGDGRDPLVWALVHAGAILAASLVNIGVVRFNQDLRERSACAERRLRRVVAVAAEGIVELDAAGRVAFANPAAGSILGCPPERLLGRSARELFPEGAFGETVAVRCDGRRVDVECAAGGGASSVIVTFHDTSRRRRAERAAEVQAAATEVLATSASLDDAAPALLRVLAEQLGWDVALLWSPADDGTLHRQVLRLADPALAEGAELLCAAVERRTDSSLAGRALRAGHPLWLADLRAAGDGDGVADELGLAAGVALPLRAGGAELGVLEFFATGPREVDAAERRLVAQLGAQLAGFLDRVDRAERAALLEEAALADALTGLPNRRALDGRLPLALEASGHGDDPLCLALIDLDHFKAYNDGHGHPEGDALLREAAVAWSGELRDGDVLSRYGGEEFALLLPRCAPEHARGVVERLLAATPRGQTASAGIASSRGRRDAAELLRAADDALYAAKRGGRAQVVLAPERRFARSTAAAPSPTAG